MILCSRLHIEGWIETSPYPIRSFHCHVKTFHKIFCLWIITSIFPYTKSFLSLFVIIFLLILIISESIASLIKSLYVLPVSSEISFKEFLYIWLRIFCITLIWCLWCNQSQNWLRHLGTLERSVGHEFIVQAIGVTVL